MYIDLGGRKCQHALPEYYVMLIDLGGRKLPKMQTLAINFIVIDVGALVQASKNRVQRTQEGHIHGVRNILNKLFNIEEAGALQTRTRFFTDEEGCIGACRITDGASRI